MFVPERVSSPEILEPAKPLRIKQINLRLAHVVMEEDCLDVGRYFRLVAIRTKRRRKLRNRDVRIVGRYKRSHLEKDKNFEREPIKLQKKNGGKIEEGKEETGKEAERRLLLLITVNTATRTIH